MIAVRTMAVALATVAVLGAAPSLASAETPSSKVVQEASTAKALKARVAALEAAGAAKQVASPNVVTPHTTVPLNETNYTPCLGSNMEATYSDSISYGWTSGQVYGSSAVYWQGSDPYNADSITYSDTHDITGPYVGWNNPGSDWNFSNDEIKWSQTVNNTWKSTHTYSLAWGGFPTWYSHDTTGDASVGGTYCTANASGTKYL